MIEKAKIFEFAEFRVDVLRRTVERERQLIALSGKAFEILVVLLENRGEVVDKDALIRRVWPDTIVEENNITVAISGLRKALGETPASRKWIVTVPGRGYSFVGELQSDSPIVEISPIKVPSASPLPPRSRTTYLLGAGVLLIALMTGLVAWLIPKPLRSVAILPFSVLNQDSKNDYLGMGLTDAVISRLARTQFNVRPLGSVSRFSGHDPIQSGRELGVDAVVTGTVQTADERIRVSVNLLRVRDSKTLWTDTFNVASESAFSLEDSIAERVASNLSGPLTGQQQAVLNKRPTANAAAYGNYLRARYYANKYSEEGLRKSLEYLQSAIDSDPGYALAYSGMADSYYDVSNLVYPPREAMPRAKAAAQRAVELDPSLAPAHVSLGLVASKYDWDWSLAEHEFQTALSLDPNLATAHLWLGVHYAQMGDFDHAISELRRAQELDPLSGEINAYLGIVLYWARRYDESVNQLQQAIRFDPAYVANYVALCWTLEARGDTKEALNACKQAYEHEVSPWTTLALARAQVLAGNRTAAIATMTSASHEVQFVSGYDRAAVYAALGWTDQAFAALDEAYQSRAEWLSYLKVDPQMDALRKDSRYSTLLKRLNL